MLKQPAPIVDMDDVERVLLRDYPPEVAAETRQTVSALDVREKVRVVLACLKVAKGDYRLLKNTLRDAPGYYRERLGEAEYPRRPSAGHASMRFPSWNVPRSTNATGINTWLGWGERHSRLSLMGPMGE